MNLTTLPQQITQTEQDKTVEVENETTSNSTETVNETIEQNSVQDVSTNQHIKIDNPKLVTVDQVASERFMIALNETLEEVSKFNEYTEEKINNHFKDIEQRQKQVENYLSSQVENLSILTETTKQLETQINTAGSYSKYLESQLKIAQTEQDNSLLRLSLNQEREKIYKTLTEIDDFIKERMSAIEEKTKNLLTADEILKQTADGFSNKLQNVVEKKIADFENDMFKQAKDAFDQSKATITGIKNDTEKLLTDYTNGCKENLTIMNQSYIKYLESTKEEHKKLVAKIPGNDTKVNKKDFLFVLITLINIVTFCLIIWNLNR